jgi:hypothetical protein
MNLKNSTQDNTNRFFKKFSSLLVFYLLILFTIYWATAFPADEFASGDSTDGINEFCYEIHMKLFWVLQFFYLQKWHLSIGVIPTFLFSLILTAGLISFLHLMIVSFFKNHSRGEEEMLDN